MSRERVVALFVGLLAAALLIGACGSSGDAIPSSKPVPGKPLRGGTASFAEQPLSPPNYIFPLISGQYYSAANTTEFQTLLYRPLYWYGNDNQPGVDYSLSLGDRPVYSDHNKVVTIRLKPARWSDGELVSARDVGFWIDLLKANEDGWASYVPGGFPDNVVRWTAVGPRTIVLRLDRAYNPAWYTGNELSQITPLPLAWDRTSLASLARFKRSIGSDGLSGTAGLATQTDDAQADGARAGTALPDTTAAGARAVYRFLNAQAQNVSGYAQSQIWSVVDGAWRLTQLTSSGRATFVPNRAYDGPDKPHLARFVELPFTSEEAEFNVLQAGSAHARMPASKGRNAAHSTGADAATGGSQITVGYVPDVDIPQARSLANQGYRLTEAYNWGFDYFEPNFNNPTVGPILKQLYFRQAFQHLVNEAGWIRGYYGGLAVPTYSPVPAQPANGYSDALARTDPYPFSIAAARRLLSAHGWRVVPDGLTVCERPGRSAGDCGAGIPAGKRLIFTLMYPTGLSYAAGAMLNLQSEAARVGIQIRLHEVTMATIDAEIEPCTRRQAACSWELGQYGEPWPFSPDHYPSGEEIFQTGALGNVNNYSDATADRLIKATTVATGAQAQRALDAYANYVRAQLPDFWQPSPGTLMTSAANLGGFAANAYGFISPQDWYLTR